MNVVDYILEGLEAELALERELGVRAVEFDRSLLVQAAPNRPPVPANAAGAKPVDAIVPIASKQRRPTASDAFETNASTGSGGRAAASARQPVKQPLNRATNHAIPDFVFLHDRALSPKGVEMMAKIIAALGKTAETAPVVIVPPLPPAKVYVILGGLALKKYFPGLRGEPGQWLTTDGGVSALVTYSPEYILRFGTVTPAVEKMKRDMWTSLKAVVQRTRA